MLLLLLLVAVSCPADRGALTSELARRRTAAKLTHEETQRALWRERSELESKLERALVRAEILAVSEIDLLDAVNAARADTILFELETSML